MNETVQWGSYIYQSIRPISSLDFQSKTKLFNELNFVWSRILITVEFLMNSINSRRIHKTPHVIVFN